MQECGEESTHVEYASTGEHPTRFEVPTCDEHRGAGSDIDGKSLAEQIVENGITLYLIGDHRYLSPGILCVDSPETWE